MARNYFLDTSFLLDLAREKESVSELHSNFRGKETTGSICIYEIRKHTEIDLNDLMGEKDVLSFSKKDAKATADIYRELKELGYEVADTCLMIGGMVRNRDLVLVTKDEEFERIPEIKILKY